ncbi:hypothetical protein HYZ82_00210 [Candidatus Nomurabacteria bacterium]|nr:hypothetical protein [Candidatus Nomurabacteria bacterium]
MDQNNEPGKIVFEGEEFQHSARSFQTATPKITEWVIKYSGGAIKDEKQANYVLIGFAAAAIIISLFLFFLGGGQDLPPERVMSEFPI